MEFEDLTASAEIEIEQLTRQLQLANNQIAVERQLHHSEAEKRSHMAADLKKLRVLEEENSAMKDQMFLQEKEIKSLENENKELRQTVQKTQTESHAELVVLRAKVQELRKENEGLQAENTKLIAMNELSKTEHHRSLKEIRALQLKLFEASQDLQRASQERVLLGEMREECLKRQKEIIVLGELYQRTKEQADSLGSNFFVRSSDAEWTLTVGTMERERDRLRNELNDARRLGDFHRAKNTDLEKELTKKETALEQLRSNLEMAKNDQKRQLTVEKQRVTALERIVVRLEQHILTLYSQLGLKKHEKRLRELQVSTNHEYDSDSTDMSVSPNAHHGSLVGSFEPTVEQSEPLRQSEVSKSES